MGDLRRHATSVSSGILGGIIASAVLVLCAQILLAGPCAVPELQELEVEASGKAIMRHACCAGAF
jgi:hypothetical protein